MMMVQPCLASNNHHLSVSSRGKPSFPSIINSRRAAKEAYLKHLQNELDSAQRQLYVSQNTCNTLRIRCEDQRRQTLELIAGNSRSSVSVGDKGQDKQHEEIEQLQLQLQAETAKKKEQVEKLALMSAELKDLQLWKETTQHENDEKLLDYEQQIQESIKKESDYAEQVELLKLKVEAAEFVAKHQRASNNVEGAPDDSSQFEERAQILRSELESIRAKYTKMCIKGIEVDENQQKIDTAIQLAVEVALETIDKDWKIRYEALERERDIALSAQQTNKVITSEQQEKQLREELTAELTDSITNEITEQLTLQLTETIEKKYKTKLKKLRKELSEYDQSQEEMSEQRQQTIEDEISKVKAQYEEKLLRLQQQCDEQDLEHKERMRKLVKALLEREKKQKERAKKKEGGKDNQDSGDELVRSTRVSSSSNMRRSKPKVVRGRGTSN